MRPAAYTKEEWAVEKLIWESGHICSNCGEDLHLTDDIVLLQVVYPGYDAQGRLDYFILQSSGGDYMYEPQFFHAGCLEELVVDFEDHISMESPHMDPEEHLQVAECTTCTAHIRAHEVSATLNRGELRCSKRSPDGTVTIYFDNCSSIDTEVICLACLWRFNEEVFEMWDKVETGVCQIGLYERCWRYGACQLGCRHMGAVAE
jgi:hypothetical protein